MNYIFGSYETYVYSKIQCFDTIFILFNVYFSATYVCTTLIYFFTIFQINEDVMLGKCPPIYHRSEPEADDANSDLDSDNQQAAVGE